MLQTWTAQDGIFRQSVPDPSTEFNLALEYPSGSGRAVHIVQPKGRDDLIIVVSSVRIAAEHKARLDSLSPSERTKFLYDLRMGLIFRQTTFQFIPSLEDPAEVRFARSIYLDGLTKNLLVESLNEVNQCFLFVAWKFQEKFGLFPGQRSGPSPYG